MQNVAEMEAMALWQMRPCWGADAAAAAPPRLVATMKLGCALKEKFIAGRWLTSIESREMSVITLD